MIPQLCLWYLRDWPIYRFLEVNRAEKPTVSAFLWYKILKINSNMRKTKRTTPNKKKTNKPHPAPFWSTRYEVHEFHRTLEKWLVVLRDRHWKHQVTSTGPWEALKGVGEQTLHLPSVCFPSSEITHLLPSVA